MEDPVENIGAKLVRQAAAKTNDLAGDGTTTSVVLAQGLIAEGVKVSEISCCSTFWKSTGTLTRVVVALSILLSVITFSGGRSWCKSCSDYQRH